MIKVQEVLQVAPQDQWALVVLKADLETVDLLKTF